MKNIVNRYSQEQVRQDEDLLEELEPVQERSIITSADTAFVPQSKPKQPEQSGQPEQEQTIRELFAGSEPAYKRIIKVLEENGIFSVKMLPPVDELLTLKGIGQALANIIVDKAAHK